MTFSEEFKTLDIEATKTKSINFPQDQVDRILQKESFSPNDLPALLSPAASRHIETLARKANKLTIQRFGKVMRFFIPLYLSNECYNNCTYCGFSMDLDYPRKTLTDPEIIKEAKLLAEKGFTHVILLTGESPKKVGTDYIAHAIELIKPYFASISIEVQPMSKTDYDIIRNAGADTLVLYQETYHKDQYAAVHLSGKKRLFDHRLDAPDRGGEAGFYKINIGSLLGLYDWRYEAIAMSHHLNYLQKTYWKTKFALSLPRIQKMIGGYNPPFKVTDQDLVQLICAFRLTFPDLAISLSTREPAELRNNLFPLGITDMSAESHTEPGGYAGSDAVEQFEISDNRQLSEIKAILNAQNYDVALKDWDKTFTKTQ